ncbi:uncharacterized protein LOC129590046 [Paramacrobiotus metropolitanus]|uniref:uncharacterized protein LOC129590046 n=1 Tax=Paramacrobiotus metropolitanus TaxID=2943436 RepID=UPI002446546D|nr:uncharacterized protein LOC129590046 [Paramacrobiotus metropolitanus]
MSRIFNLCVLLPVVTWSNADIGITRVYDRFTVECVPSLTFSNTAVNQTDCFAGCPPATCLVAVYNLTTGHCATVANGALCQPVRVDENADQPTVFMQLNVRAIDFSYRTSHALTSQGNNTLNTLDGLWHLWMGREQCAVFCGLFPTCNGMRVDAQICDLLHFDGKQTAMRGREDGPLCSVRNYVYYQDKTQAPMEEGCDVITTPQDWM